MTAVMRSDVVFATELLNSPDINRIAPQSSLVVARFVLALVENSMLAEELDRERFKALTVCSGLIFSDRIKPMSFQNLDENLSVLTSDKRFLSLLHGVRLSDCQQHGGLRDLIDYLVEWWEAYVSMAP